MWKEECQSAFDDLKRKLVIAPVLAFPNFDKRFVLETDASIKGFGAMLSQQQERMIRYIQLLFPAELYHPWKRITASQIWKL